MEPVNGTDGGARALVNFVVCLLAILRRSYRELLLPTLCFFFLVWISESKGCGCPTAAACLRVAEHELGRWLRRWSLAYCQKGSRVFPSLSFWLVPTFRFTCMYAPKGQRRMIHGILSFMPTVMQSTLICSPYL